MLRRKRRPETAGIRIRVAEVEDGPKFAFCFGEEPRRADYEEDEPEEPHGRDRPESFGFMEEIPSANLLRSNQWGRGRETSVR